VILEKWIMAYDAGFASGHAYRARELATGYITLGTRDMARASRFYELIAREMGVGRSVESEAFVGWGLPGRMSGFGVALPDAVPELQRGMVPLQVEDPGQVQRLYEIALSNGGAGEGEPSARGGMYAAYFRDPDGNRLNAFCITEH
jgi:catechol 2,3-dioxygenase-like lactoylglutathione lyase family enzyme